MRIWACRLLILLLGQFTESTTHLMINSIKRQLIFLLKHLDWLNLKFFHIDKMPKNFLDFHKIPLKQYKEYLKTGKVIIG